jgi:hypothetical protein
MLTAKVLEKAANIIAIPSTAGSQLLRPNPQLRLTDRRPVMPNPYYWGACRSGSHKSSATPCAVATIQS